MRKQGSEKVSHTTLKLLDTCSTLVKKEDLTPRYRRSFGYFAQSIHKEPHNILLFIYPLVASYDLTVLLPNLASTGRTTDLIIASGCLTLSLPLEALRTDYPDW